MTVPRCYRFQAMAGENEIQLSGGNPAMDQAAVDSAIAEVRRIEAKFSRYRSDSVISAVNSSAGRGAMSVDDETAALLDYAEACFKQSDGLFDITCGVLRRAWNFQSGKLPACEEIEALLPMVGWSKITWRRPHLTLPAAGMELDFGGIGKEYAVDRVAGVLEDYGCKHALINFAGDVRVTGPQSNGRPWALGIADPEHRGELCGTMELTSGGAATSGDYERRIEIDGKRYSHILNPRTGWPTSGLQSVTVCAPSCLIAGSISTTAMLLGTAGERYIQKLGVPYVIVTTAGAVHSSGECARRSQFMKPGR